MSAVASRAWTKDRIIAQLRTLATLATSTQPETFTYEYSWPEGTKTPKGARETARKMTKHRPAWFEYSPRNAAGALMPVGQKYKVLSYRLTREEPRGAAVLPRLRAAFTVCLWDTPPAFDTPLESLLDRVATTLHQLLTVTASQGKMPFPVAMYALDLLGSSPFAVTEDPDDANLTRLPHSFNHGTYFTLGGSVRDGELES